MVLLAVYSRECRVDGFSMVAVEEGIERGELRCFEASVAVRAKRIRIEPDFAVLAYTSL